MIKTLKVFGAALGYTLGLALPFAMQSPAHAADDALVQRGAYLAKLGDCVACHSAPKGKPFAGGLPMSTPMGKIYSTNITPDPDTGARAWRRTVTTCIRRCRIRRTRRSRTTM
jgi:mono/diheme cytochrome c family protein